MSAYVQGGKLELLKINPQSKAKTNPGKGGGGTKKNLIRGGSAQGPTPYPFIYHFWQKRYPFRIPYIDKWYPFHI